MTRCLLFMVARFEFPNTEPKIEGIHWTPSPAFTQAGKVKQAYPSHRVVVMEARGETEIR